MRLFFLLAFTVLPLLSVAQAQMVSVPTEQPTAPTTPNWDPPPDLDPSHALIGKLTERLGTQSATIGAACSPYTPNIQVYSQSFRGNVPAIEHFQSYFMPLLTAVLTDICLDNSRRRDIGNYMHRIEITHDAQLKTQAAVRMNMPALTIAYNFNNLQPPDQRTLTLQIVNVLNQTITQLNKARDYSRFNPHEE